ncbi:protein-glutamate O-methyltransferase CheR [Paracoccus aurantiacus]|uniref:Chemotaxis protein methyltransferase n=1 Tax=Paracoccus aurantiacus TaxID=2599412 RepID=A0A5C6S9I1_9RHOB|nr:protein-glutamate O-methyltransferase CheR [Paracoccus aurantiacus]TXB71116.1 protein-glutamate O-methyltransferase CheR [Paracoccus aurantiacus]
MTYSGRAPRDAAMSDREFDQLSKIIYAFSGIVIGPEKRSLMLARLQKRVSALKLSSLADYVELLNGLSGAAERNMFVSSLTTNVTSFFRERHHFRMLTAEIIPSLAEPDRSIDIWSAGCSSGQEPYSIAMSLRERCADAAARTRILATDIDARVLEAAKTGIFKFSELSALPADLRSRYFSACTATDQTDKMRVAPVLASMIEFRQLNLNSQWKNARLFDVIFFRNVAIYFDAATQRALWYRFHACLRPGGWLLIGHSERVPADMHDLLVPAGITAYRKPQ